MSSDPIRNTLIHLELNRQIKFMMIKIVDLEKKT